MLKGIIIGILGIVPILGFFTMFINAPWFSLVGIVCYWAWGAFGVYKLCNWILEEPSRHTTEGKKF